MHALRAVTAPVALIEAHPAALLSSTAGTDKGLPIGVTGLFERVGQVDHRRNADTPTEEDCRLTRLGEREMSTQRTH